MTSLLPTESRPPLGFLCLSGSWGGLEINTVKLAYWLRERGWAVTIITHADSPIAKQATAQQLPVELLTNPWKTVDVPAARRLARFIRQHGIRVLIVTQNRDLGLAVLAKTLFIPHLKVIYQQHMQLGLAKRGLVHTLRYRATDAWLAPLPWLAQQVRQQTRMDPARIHVVPLGIDLQQFIQPKLTPAQARQQLQLPAAARLLGLIGRFDHGKGQYFVVQAFHQLRQELPDLDVQLVLVGESTKNQQRASTYRASVLALIDELGLAPYVHVREFTQQPEVFYRAIDVFVMASVSETYGMVTIEAMAAGLPIVATRVGGSIEIVREGETGLLYPPGDQATFVAAVKHVLLHEDEARQMAAQAQQEAVRQYAYQHQCELTEAVIQSLVGGSSTEH